MKAWPAINVEPVAAIAAADARMGEMLMSAIQRGALIDPRWWGPWIAAVQCRVTYDGGQLCVDMLPRDGVGLAFGRPRRWFADPLTRLLILRWHRDDLVCPAGTTPEICLAALHGHAGVATEGAMERLVRRGADRWRYRLPSALHHYAAGSTLSFSLPQETWRRLAFGLTFGDAADDHVVRYEKAITKRQRGSHGPAMMAQERRALEGSQGARSARQWKVDVIDRLRRLPPPSSAIQGNLRQWLVHGLDKGPGRQSKGYSPATLPAYLRVLDRVFSGWSDHRYVNATPADIRELFVDCLEARENPDDDTPIKAMLAFARFYDEQTDGEGLTLELDEFWSDKPGAADLVTPSTYARALGMLDRAGDEDGALLLILAFRTGARVDELRALRVGDLALSATGFEMVIESNPARMLKTKTSRRIVPLDVLLEPAERERLERRRVERLMAGGDVAEAWLFGSPLAVEPPTKRVIEGMLEGVLTAASGSASTTAHHLRHSFVSFLLATLMLPADIEHPDIPAELSSVISRARFDRVADRLLGRERLGAGAVHAVAQLAGHTGAAMTLRYYCHLLDLILGLHVSRPTVMRPIEEGWLRARLRLGEDAVRKARSRHRAPEVCPIAHDHHRRPNAQDLLSSTPGASEGMATIALLDAATMKVGRSMRRQQQGRAQRTALWTGRGPDLQLPPASAAAARTRLPWPTIMESLSNPKANAHAVGVDGATLSRWRRNAPASIAALASVWCPDQRDLIELVERWTSLSRLTRRAEREALQTLCGRWARGERDIRLKRLREARAFVDLLAEMGFVRDEIRLSVTGSRGSRLSSDTVHEFFAGRGPAMFLAGRGGWRGSLVVRLIAHERARSRSALDAARFAVLMLAIDAVRP